MYIELATVSTQVARTLQPAAKASNNRSQKKEPKLEKSARNLNLNRYQASRNEPPRVHALSKPADGPVRS